ncbi:MAG: Asp-tRNA(Asn)/Glu-tRNA(Gln) amidotransferase subunit GatA [Acidobacteria bacterium]|nr:Asp-tRNA(Asn)/Glu-tRNA(Gln) amidotransferase subunit GatA [Acidobacteriota bacterium]
MTILEAAAALRAGQVSSLELTRAALHRIAASDSALRSFITVTVESALQQARAADQELVSGPDRGPLHGIPVAVKDVFCTRGVLTTCGSKIFADHVPDHDAAVVERLRAAGAVLAGKTNLHELAYGITSSNPHFGVVRNPCDTQRIPGGSSGGSAAAVAAGMVFMAMGSDTGGSIRIPASFCGCVGLKPTYGRVSRYGVMPLDFSLDHMGPLTRSVRDAALTLQALAGHDPRDDTSSREPVPDYLPPEDPSLAGLRLGLPENFYFDQVQEEVAAAVRAAAAAAQGLGARVSSVRVPDIAGLNTVARIILYAEASAGMEPYLERREDFGEDVRSLLEQGRLVAATDYVNAQRLRRMFVGQFRALFREVDALLTPATPITAPRIGQAEVDIGGQSEDARLASTRLVRGINALGLPALSVPCGADSQGLPIGLQIIGRPFEEALILRIGAALEAAGSGTGPGTG